MAETALTIPAFRCPECATEIGGARRITPQENRFLDNLASGKFDTVQEAALKAGYSATSASTYTYQKLRDPSTAIELHRRKQAKADKARDIFSRALRAVNRELMDTADPEFALKAMAVSAQVLEKGVDTEEAGLSPEATRDMLRSYRRRFMARAVRMALYRERKRAAAGVGGQGKPG